MRTLLVAAGLLLASLVATLPTASASCNIYSDSSGRCIASGPGSTTLPSVCHAPCGGSPCVLDECLGKATWPAYCVAGWEPATQTIFMACVPT